MGLFTHNFNLKKGRAVPPLPIWPFVACYKVNFTFTFTVILINANRIQNSICIEYICWILYLIYLKKPCSKSVKASIWSFKNKKKHVGCKIWGSIPKMG